jgi:hypothetical protein
MQMYNLVYASIFMEMKCRKLLITQSVNNSRFVLLKDYLFEIVLKFT